MKEAGSAYDKGLSYLHPQPARLGKQKKNWKFVILKVTAIHDMSFTVYREALAKHCHFSLTDVTVIRKNSTFSDS